MISAASTVFDDGRRLSTITYPSGRVFTYDYGTSPAIDEVLNRVVTVMDASSAGAYYAYNGAARVAQVDSGYFTLDYTLSSGSSYGGWDRFGRVKDQYWKCNTVSDIDRFKYEYDYAGSPKYRDIDTAIYATNTKDQAWTYDGLERLKTFDRGTLPLSGTTITETPEREQDWTLDALGNWKGLVVKTAGTTNLNRSRGHNLANEITCISAWSVGLAAAAAGKTDRGPR